MKKLFLAMAILAAIGSQARANELDNENNVTNVEQRNLAQNLPATLVVRVATDGSVAVLHSATALDPSADPSTVTGNFTAMKTTDTQNELDNDSSTSGWYFYWNNYSYAAPTYSYYGYNYFYRPYYNYYYNNYNYYWYRWY